MVIESKVAVNLNLVRMKTFITVTLIKILTPQFKSRHKCKGIHQLGFSCSLTQIVFDTWMHDLYCTLYFLFDEKNIEMVSFICRNRPKEQFRVRVGDLDNTVEEADEQEFEIEELISHPLYSSQFVDLNTFIGST